MLDDIRCRGGLNIVRDSEVTCGSVPQRADQVGPEIHVDLAKLVDNLLSKKTMLL